MVIHNENSSVVFQYSPWAEYNYLIVHELAHVQMCTRSNFKSPLLVIIFFPHP